MFTIPPAVNKGKLSSHSCKHLLPFVYLLIPIMSVREMKLQNTFAVYYIHWLKMLNTIKNYFQTLFFFSFEKGLFISLAHLLVGTLDLVFNFSSSLYILNINSLTEVLLIKIALLFNNMLFIVLNSCFYCTELFGFHIIPFLISKDLYSYWNLFPDYA